MDSDLPTMEDPVDLYESYVKKLFMDTLENPAEYSPYDFPEPNSMGGSKQQSEKPTFPDRKRKRKRKSDRVCRDYGQSLRVDNSLHLRKEGLQESTYLHQEDNRVLDHPSQYEPWASGVPFHQTVDAEQNSNLNKVKNKTEAICEAIRDILDSVGHEECYPHAEAQLDVPWYHLDQPAGTMQNSSDCMDDNAKRTEALFAEVRDILKTFKPDAYCPVAEVPSEIAEHQVAEADHRWSLDKDQRKTEAIYETVKDILNNLKPETFRGLQKKFSKLQINTSDRMKGVLDLILQKAIDEPRLCKWYVKLSRSMPHLIILDGDSKKTFKKLLDDLCQRELERRKVTMLDGRNRLKDVHACVDPKMKEELRLRYNKNLHETHRRTVSVMKLMGELFSQRLLLSRIIVLCVRQLLEQIDDLSMTCLCDLLMTTGKDFGQKVAADLDPHIRRIHEIIANETYILSPETRLMLRDILEAWKNSWMFEKSEVTNQTKSNIKNTDQTESETKNTGQTIRKIEKDETMVFKIAISGSGEPNTDPVEVEKESEAIYRRVRDLLNKFKPSKLRFTLKQLKKFQINSIRLRVISSMIFEKMISNLQMRSEYVKLCLALQHLAAPHGGYTVITFPTLMRGHCLKQFERDVAEEIERNKHEVKIILPVPAKKTPKLPVKKKDCARYQKAIGNCMFIGELFREKLLDSETVVYCIRRLLEHVSELSMLCLCRMLITAGKELEQQVPGGLNQVFDRMKTIGRMKHYHNLTKAARLIKQVTILRKQSWISEGRQLSYASSMPIENTKAKSAPGANYTIRLPPSESECQNSLISSTTLPQADQAPGLVALTAPDDELKRCSSSVLEKREAPNNSLNSTLLDKKEPGVKVEAIDIDQNATSREETKIQELKKEPGVNVEATDVDLNATSRKETKTEASFATVRSMLANFNKPMYNDFVEQFKRLDIETGVQLREIAALIFDKGVNKPGCSFLFAQLCREMQHLTVPYEGGATTFKMAILEQCRNHMEHGSTAELKAQQISAPTGPKKKLANCQKQKLDKAPIGAFKFIAALFREQVVTADMMVNIIRQLLNRIDDASAKCLSKLFKITGKSLEKEVPEDVAAFCREMQVRAESKTNRLSNNSRNMLMSIVNSQSKCWNYKGYYKSKAIGQWARQKRMKKEC